MVRGGPGSYRLRLNDSEIEAEIHTLRDGGLLMQASNHLSTTSFQTLFIWHVKPHYVPYENYSCLRWVSQLDGNSHIIYAEEEAAGTRLLIDGRTCLLQVSRLFTFRIHTYIHMCVVSVIFYVMFAEL